MYFDTKAYADAISQLAKALAELEPQSVYQLFEPQNVETAPEVPEAATATTSSGSTMPAATSGASASVMATA